MRSIVKRAVLAAALFACTGTAVAIETGRTNDLLIRYEMSVGTDGKATSLKSLNPLPAEIDQKLQERVRSFVFTPATRNGIAQPAETTLYLTLGQIQLPDGSGGYNITALNTGPRRLANATREAPPPRPAAGYFVATYDQDGRVKDVDFDKENSPGSSRPFQKWAMKLVGSFRFKPEVVAGIPVQGSVRIPIVFCGNAGNVACPVLERFDPAGGNDLGGDMIAESVLKLSSPLKSEPAI